jgi:hypothetical protein
VLAVGGVGAAGSHCCALITVDYGLTCNETNTIKWS